jgi:tRNA threonylcarbamoyl adenosine modification protein YeaZ
LVSDAPVLAFDTSAAHCAAALLLGDRVISRAEEMTRGQAERLMPLLQEVLAEGGVTFEDLSRIGVGIGPGNFTGIRISVSAARGLALGLGIPAIGVSGFDALRLGTATDWAAIPAPRDMAYVQRAGADPVLVSVSDVPDGAVSPDAPTDLASAIARIAAAAALPVDPPAPLYIRPADAAPSRDVPPVILDDA